MSVIKDIYGKAELSHEKKAELRRTLKESFPQYDHTDTGRTEVVIMENERIDNTGGRAKVRSKFKTGIAAAAAAALIVTVGVSAVKHMDIGTPSAGSQTGYIDDRNSPYYQQAKSIYNSMAETLADYEVNGYSYNHLVETAGFEITRDDILEARSTAIVRREGSEIQAIELADSLDKIAARDGIDLGEIDFRIDFSHWSYNLVYYVFVYPDASHESFYSYPHYDESLYDEPSYEESELDRQARAIYNSLAEIMANCETRGVSFEDDCSVINRDSVLLAKTAGYDGEAIMSEIINGERELGFVSAAEVAALLDASDGHEFDLIEVDFEAVINVSSMTLEYVLVYEDSAHTNACIYPKDGEDTVDSTDDETDNEYTELVNEIALCMLKVSIDIEYDGDKLYVDSGIIDRDTVLKSRKVKIDHEEGKVSGLEYAMLLDYAVKDKGLDLSKIDFTASFDPGKRRFDLNSLTVYPDESHETYYRYHDDYEPEDAYELTYTEADAEVLYEEADQLFQSYISAGKTVSAETLDTLEMWHTIFNEGKYPANHNEDLIRMVDFYNHLPAVSSIAASMNSGRPDSYIIEFSSNDGETATGIRSVTVKYIIDGKGAEFTYRPENISVPNVIGMKYTEAEELLKKSDLTVALETVPDDTAEPGSVIDQSIAPESEVEVYTEITLYIAADNTAQ